MQRHLQGQGVEYALLLLLAVMWGSSYLFIALAVTEIAPLTLISFRVVVSSFILLGVMRLWGEALPRRLADWRPLVGMAILNSIGAWTVLAWGQQYVDSSLASILNSTPPIFVVLFSVLLGRSGFGIRALLGVVLGLAGVVLIIGVSALQSLGVHVLGQLACVLGAAFYGGAAIYSGRLTQFTPLQISASTMIIASVVLTPAAIVVEGADWVMPSAVPLAAALALAIFSTAFALLVYFRLVRTLGPLGAASQSYLRVGVGVLLGIVLLGERLGVAGLLGFVLCILGVLLINWPQKQQARAEALAP